MLSFASLPFRGVHLPRTRTESSEAEFLRLPIAKATSRNRIEVKKTQQPSDSSSHADRGEEEQHKLFPVFMSPVVSLVLGDPAIDS